MGATGIEPVTPTMSTYQAIDFTYENAIASGFEIYDILAIEHCGSKKCSAKTLQNHATAAMLRNASKSLILLSNNQPKNDD